MGPREVGPTPEHSAPASRPTQDSYVSKGGPLGGYGMGTNSFQQKNQGFIMWNI